MPNSEGVDKGVDKVDRLFKVDNKLSKLVV
jgi:hypothetical protein